MIQQQKILANIKTKRFWLTLRGLAYSFCALKSNFAKRKAEKVQEEVRNFSSWRIAYRFKVSLIFKNMHRFILEELALTQMIEFETICEEHLH